MIKYALIAAAVAVALGTSYEFGRSHGAAGERAAVAKQVARRLNDAQMADDANSRCLVDPACRLRNDGFRRD